jgi:hypothetical protein
VLELDFNWGWHPRLTSEHGNLLGSAKMGNINGNGRTRFQRMLLCATMGLAVSVSLCFAQGNRDDVSLELRFQEMTRLITVPPEKVKPLVCDSLAPEVCFDIYRRRMERAADAAQSSANADYRCEEWGLLHPNPFNPSFSLGSARISGGSSLCGGGVYLPRQR